MLGWGGEGRWDRGPAMNNQVALQGPKRDLPRHPKPHSVSLPSLVPEEGVELNLKPVMENLHSHR